MAEGEDPESVRAWRCRLTSDRWLIDLDEAHQFLEERHLLTLTPDCALPSLFGACEPVTDPAARGFAKWPEDKWWWDKALVERPGYLKTKLRCGKVMLLDQRAADAADVLCREEEESAQAGRFGSDAQRVVAFLDAGGPALLDEIKADAGLDAKELRRVRSLLEARGALVSREVTVEAASGGHRHVSELAVWSQRRPDPVAGGGLGELAQLAVRAAVIAPRAEVRTWFSWPMPDALLDELIEDERLSEPRPGWLTSPQ